ncbi:MAG TPA: hypothetical protein VFU84_00675 [Gaiellaceae bacterium]|nr:hypothetical protein [Gaiellaceae bacterium]
MPQRLPRFYRHLQAIEDARRIGRILEETGEIPEGPASAGATAAGDPSRLRGIPAVGRGCSGAIPGTRPGENLFRESRRR